MNTRPVLASFALVVLLAVAAPAYADVYSYNGVNYTIPSGYQSYSGSQGIFYNPNTGTYYNPVTGQTSSSPLIGSSVNYTYGSYQVPQGYQPYSWGIYYNPSTGMYYNPRNGQSSAQAPTGPAAHNAYNGSYVIPAGYTYYNYSTYYNSSTNSYYEPESGFYSSTAPGPTTYTYNPVQQVVPVPVYVQTVPTYTVAQPVYYPTLPSTGAGGDASATIMLLMISGLVAVGGALSMRRLAYS